MKLSKRGSLLDMEVRNGKTYFVKTETGQFFYDLVMSNKSLKHLARKWKRPIDELRSLRAVGRKAMKQSKVE
jgi:hypothetical protein